jgi:hypothetical protein
LAASESFRIDGAGGEGLGRPTSTVSASPRFLTGNPVAIATPTGVLTASSYFVAP